MTESPRVTPLSFENVDDVAAAIRAAGGRLTAARRLLVESLFEADGPISAEQLANRLARRGPAFDLPSVYRNLERLESLGIVRHVHFGHGPGLYALIRGGEREYLSCERCRRVKGVEPSELDPIREQIKARFGYQARFTHFPITGLCAECAAETKREGDPMSDHEHDHSHDEPHAHEHSHGDMVHSHPHTHQKGLEHDHRHQHEGA